MIESLSDHIIVMLATANYLIQIIIIITLVLLFGNKLFT
jgi:hypothetical protein